jgi:hypothetical protein
VPDIPPLINGNKPTDGGALSNISPDDAAYIREYDPVAAKYLRRIIGAAELLQGEERWCLWLEGVEPQEIRKSNELTNRVAYVAEFRSQSTKATTRADAARPQEFQQIRQPTSRYLVIPLVSSAGRRYVPVASYDPDTIVNNLVSVIADSSLQTMGVLSSRIFRVWTEGVSGRLKSDPRISNEITYNNFPWPRPTSEQTETIERAAEGVLVVRQHFMDSTLADLYDPLAMPRQLQEAHHVLDAAVSEVFDLPTDASDADILKRLFELYAELTGGMFPRDPAPARRKRAA